MRNRVIYTGARAIAIALVLLAANDTRAGTRGYVNAFLGEKALNEDDWAPGEDQNEIGLLVSLTDETWPIAFAIDLLRSSEDVFEGTVDLSTVEVDLGVRKIWKRGGFRPFVGGGAGFVQGKVDVSNASSSDEAAGVWVDGGAFLQIASHFNIGFEARYSFATISLLKEDVDAGGRHLGVLIGFGW